MINQPAASSGPIAGAKTNTIPNTPKASSTLSWWKGRKSKAVPSGSAIPPPTPWIARDAIRRGNV